MDLSLASLFTSPGYSITWRFTNIDLINGGPHFATDVGNFGMNDPIKAPADLPARGLYHFDTAIGVEYALGDGWTLALWHLNATLSPLQMIPGQSSVGPWRNVVKGEVCGRTGNSGALVNGNPMPAHTHIRLEHDGIPFDVEPYLLGQPFGEDMQLPAGTQVIAQGTVPPGTALRSLPAVADETLIRRTEAETQLAILWLMPGQGFYAKDGKQYRDWLAVALGDEVGYVAKEFVYNVFVTAAGQTLLPPAPAAGGFTQAQVDAAKVAGFVDAKTKARIAVEAITP